MIWFNLTMTRMTDMNIHLTVSIQIVGKGNFEGRISVGGALNMNMCKDANGLRMSNNPPVIQNCACWKITHTVRGFPQHCDGTSEGMLFMKSPVIPLNFFPSHYTHPIQSHILVDLFPIKSYALQCPGARLSYHAGVSWSHHGDPATVTCVARVFDGYFMWIHRYTQYMLWDMTKQLDIPWYGIWLMVDLPLWKIWKSVGMIIPSIYMEK